jgi:plasmid maintenance system antidote protein VapI
MTPARYHECLRLIGWTQRGLADRLSVHETRARRWGNGQYPIPDDVAERLERLAAVHARWFPVKVGS